MFNKEQYEDWTTYYPQDHEDDDDDTITLMVLCGYPGCDNYTTRDPVYGNLCYRHIRADNE